MSFPGYVPIPRRSASPAGFFAPWIIGSAALILAWSSHSRVGHWLRGFMSGLDECVRRRTQPSLSPTRLRDRILGLPKSSVAAELGPPRAAALLHSGDTWYYAIDPRRELAMAVVFENDEARAVEFFQSPRE